MKDIVSKETVMRCQWESETWKFVIKVVDKSPLQKDNKAESTSGIGPSLEWRALPCLMSNLQPIYSKALSLRSNVESKFFYYTAPTLLPPWSL